MKEKLVIIGNGMAPGRMLEKLFETDPDLSGRILVLAPHPDDAEIGAFGLYANREATVVTVTAGNAGSNTYAAVFGEDDVAAAYQFKGRIRAIDSVTVPWQGRIPPQRAFNLGYFDARLGEMHARRNEVIPEMYGPNTDIGVYRRENLGSLLPKGPRESRWAWRVEFRPPIRRMAWRRASSRGRPRRSFSSVRSATWVANSSSNSLSSARRRMTASARETSSRASRIMRHHLATRP